MRERIVWIIVVAALAVLALVERQPVHRSLVGTRPGTQPGVRLAMDALHQQGGVPLGWQLTPPPGDVDAGRRAFRELGCGTCHESSADATGPDLTGMGSHHPAAYFVEAILNPDAVLVDWPGAIGADGHSTMPAYPDLTVAELADLVAYLGSLRDDAPAPALPPSVKMTPLELHDRPLPGAGAGKVFFAQSYDVRSGRLEAFEAWFATKGRRAFAGVNGLVGVDTYVDLSRAAPAVTSLFAFRDEAALRNFMGDPGSAALWRELDGFIGPHGHLAVDHPLVYRAPSLSTNPRD